MIVKTEAIVLKKMNFRDTSRIVGLLTEDYGRLSVIAKGARDSRSKFGPVLDTFNHLQVVLYRKEGRDLHLLSQCTLLTRFTRLTEDLERLASAMSVVDLVSAVTRDGEESKVMFGTVMQTLAAINSGDDPHAAALYFQARLLSLLGFEPDLFHCTLCKASVELPGDGTKNSVLRLSADGILCHRCKPVRTVWMTIRPETLAILRTCQQVSSGWQGVVNVPLDARHEVTLALSNLLRTHVEGIGDLKSGPVLASMTRL